MPRHGEVARRRIAALRRALEVILALARLAAGQNARPHRTARPERAARTAGAPIWKMRLIFSALPFLCRIPPAPTFQPSADRSTVADLMLRDGTAPVVVAGQSAGCPTARFVATEPLPIVPTFATLS